MIKQGLTFVMAATLLVVSGSFAKADIYSITSDWITGSTANNNLITYTGDGTFTWDGTVDSPGNYLPTGFSNIDFSYSETTPTSSVLWSVPSGTDGAYLSTPVLDLGNGSFDCGGDNCVTIALSAPLTEGAPLTITGISSGSSEQGNLQPFLVDATITDLSYPTPEPSAWVLLASMMIALAVFVRVKVSAAA